MIIKVVPEKKILEKNILDGEGYKNVAFRDKDGTVWRYSSMWMQFLGNKKINAHVTAIVCENGRLTALYLKTF